MRFLVMDARSLLSSPCAFCLLGRFRPFFLYPLLCCRLPAFFQLLNSMRFLGFLRSFRLCFYMRCLLCSLSTNAFCFPGSFFLYFFCLPRSLFLHVLCLLSGRADIFVLFVARPFAHMFLLHTLGLHFRFALARCLLYIATRVVLCLWVQCQRSFHRCLERPKFCFLAEYP